MWVVVKQKKADSQPVSTAAAGGSHFQAHFFSQYYCRCGFMLDELVAQGIDNMGTARQRKVLLGR